MNQDCIAAISTPPGIGALAIVRMSGLGCLDVFDRIFRGDGTALGVEDRGVIVGRVIDPGSGEAIDEVVATLFRGPRSYTGEDMVEIGCHGGRYVPSAVLDVCLRGGARAAGPGEFTRRAYRNGKLDLIQAEAVAAMIGSSTRRAHRLAVRQFDRALSRAVGALRGALVELIARLEYEIDFPDEERGDREAIRRGADDVQRRIAALAGTWREGAIVTEGALVVIAGCPNVGKSSLFNLMARRDRSIVSPHPGTTRDAIEQEVSLSGLRVRLVDTAGLRETGDDVERLGVEVSRRYLEAADLVLFVTDATCPPSEAEAAFLEGLVGRDIVLAANKVDRLPGRARGPRLGHEPVYVSAETGEGFEALREKIVAHALGGEPRDDGAVIWTVRQRESCRVAGEALSRAVEGLAKGLGEEFVVEDLRCAARALEELIGDVCAEDVLDVVFARFCVGK